MDGADIRKADQDADCDPDSDPASGRFVQASRLAPQAGLRSLSPEFVVASGHKVRT